MAPIIQLSQIQSINQFTFSIKIKIIDIFKISDIDDNDNGSPIIINNNAIGSGRHRVCAMIGRLIEGYDYIPFYYPRF